MSITFNADEIFKIGVQIERNGYAFYLEAAERATNSDIKKLLNELARWEERHIEIFENLRKSLSSSYEVAEYDPDNMVHLYLKSIADSHIFIKGQKMNAILDACKNSVDILSNALEFEKDSVVFYSSMKEIVRNDLGKKDIDTLIHEELLHVGMIVKGIKNLSGGCDNSFL